ncbi:hypothetical protein CFOL_v3_24319, partial [Cephalotus follicularis]
HINITITIQDSFKITALMHSGAQINRIQEELIPTKYFEKTKQNLSTINGENLIIKFKVTDIHNEGICIKQSFILVKDLDIGIIPGEPFLEIIKPFKVKTEGITTKIFQQKILFAFNEKLINLLKTFSLFKEHSVNLKENHLYFMKPEQNLHTSQIKEKINSLKNNIINNLCSDLPNAFLPKKRHMMSLSYIKDLTEQNIPTKTKPIQTIYELMKHCKKEIQKLLIRPSKLLWSCTTFYVNQGIQRSVINYKTLKIRFYSTFRRYEWTVILIYENVKFYK